MHAGPLLKRFSVQGTCRCVLLPCDGTGLLAQRCCGDRSACGRPWSGSLPLGGICCCHSFVQIRRTWLRGRCAPCRRGRDLGIHGARQRWQGNLEELWRGGRITEWWYGVPVAGCVSGETRLAPLPCLKRYGWMLARLREWSTKEGLIGQTETSKGTIYGMTGLWS